MRKEKGVELLQTTRCFAENDTLFYGKRHVVLLKTIRCFIENDTLFYWKRHVVLLKTIRCFWKNNTFKGTNWTFLFRPLWHLWQQKSKIAVGCACVRTYARSIPWGTHPKIRELGELSLWAKFASESEKCEVLATDIYLDLPCFAFFGLQHWWLFLWKVHFIANFSLFAPISPHIQIGEQEMKNISYIENFPSAIMSVLLSGGEESEKPIATDDVWYK